MPEPAPTAPTATPLQRGRPPQDDIPQTRAERDRLARVVQDYARAETLVPPLSLEELRAHCDAVIPLAGLEEKHRDYAAVLLNNAAWQETVAGVPYDRRLLLLPKCLRFESRCTAAVDEFGLVCAHCGLCDIHHLQTEAERLGYVVLVSEGTAVVTSLIESGKIQAVVGVGCLAALERVFPYMEAAAIPGIAIPLLHDGCSATSMDIDRVREAMYLTRSDATRHVDLDALRAEVDSWFSPGALEGILGPASSQTEKLARAWLTRSGKRWRPFLAVCAFQAYQKNPEAPLPEDLRKIALAVECFHKASLVHDDIEDNDPLRYGEKTLHAEHGTPIALNVGDFLIGEGYRLIAECQASPERKEQMLRAATSGHRSLCIGQGEELCWMRRPRPLTSAQVIDIFRQKTAPAFEVALRLGTIFASANGDVGDILTPYSESLGIAYQIRDDLTDFRGEAESRNPEAAGPSILLALAHERATGDARRLLEAAWRRPAPPGNPKEQMEKILADMSIEQAARQLMESYKEQAIRSLRPLDSVGLKGLLRRVIGRIFNELGKK